MANFGAIYIAHNPRDGAHVYKVGKTIRDVASRMIELSSSTSNLGTYSVSAYFVVSDVDAAERACHRHLNPYRIQSNREFFELEFSRLLSLVEEMVAPYRVRDFIPSIRSNTPGERTTEPEPPLAERIRQRREQMEQAAEIQQKLKRRFEEALNVKLERWEEDMRIKITVVRQAFEDLPFIRWEDLEGTCRYPNHRIVALVTLLVDSDDPPLRLKFTHLVNLDDPLKPEAERDAPFRVGDTMHVLETWEEDDDQRVARLSITLLGKGTIHPGKILVKAERIEYDGYHCEWKQHVVGETYSSSSDEAVDILSNLLAEYAARPITK